MTNTWITSYRTAQRRPAEVLAADVTDVRISAATPSAELAALDAMGDDEVLDALRALPEGQRMVVYYADVEGFRYKEIAAIMDMPLGTVMSRGAPGQKKFARIAVGRRRRARLRGLVGSRGWGCAAAVPDVDERLPDTGQVRLHIGVICQVGLHFCRDLVARQALQAGEEVVHVWVGEQVVRCRRRHPGPHTFEVGRTTVRWVGGGILIGVRQRERRE